MKNYIEQWYSGCNITFKTTLNAAPEVVQALIRGLKGTIDKNNNVVSSLSVAELIILNLFEGDLNFLSNANPTENPLNLDFPEVA